jgi:hypothetical protein
MSESKDFAIASLGEVISHLEKLPRDMIVSNGFGNPHSYRGIYADLAFEPKSNTTVGKMLDEAKTAVGEVYEGYKGGNFEMGLYSDCWLAEFGCSGVPIILPGTGIPYVLPVLKEAGHDLSGLLDEPYASLDD